MNGTTQRGVARVRWWWTTTIWLTKCPCPVACQFATCSLFSSFAFSRRRRMRTGQGRMLWCLHEHRGELSLFLSRGIRLRSGQILLRGWVKISLLAHTPATIVFIMAVNLVNHWGIHNPIVFVHNHVHVCTVHILFILSIQPGICSMLPLLIHLLSRSLPLYSITIPFSQWPHW